MRKVAERARAAVETVMMRSTYAFSDSFFLILKSEILCSAECWFMGDFGLGGGEEAVDDEVEAVDLAVFGGAVGTGGGGRGGGWGRWVVGGGGTIEGNGGAGGGNSGGGGGGES